jgi:hypothetical protein
LLAACGSGSGSDGHGASKSAGACFPAQNGHSGPGHFRFNTKACENSTLTAVTLPLHRGKSHGRTVWYVVTDASDRATAQRLGVNYVPKLKNALGTPAVQTATDQGGVTVFPGTVDFHHKLVIVPGPQGFPPKNVAPPAVGDKNYSPLIKLPSGVVLNAPQVANWTGQADKAVDIDPHHRWVKYLEQHGFYEDKMVHYTSFDASNVPAAALEDVTYAPALQSAPRPGDEGLKTSAREELVAFTNGPTGKENPYHQGLNSAILDGVGPDNLLHETPVLPDHADVGDLKYAPLWDVHLASWTPQAIANGDRVELRSPDEVDQRVADKLITAPGGGKFGPSGFLVNCPLISVDLP